MNGKSPQPDDVVYLVDVDNTLLDNDAVNEDLKRHLVDAFGVDCQQRYLGIFENLRRELGYADYLGALQRYRAERPRDARVLEISLYLLHYPFAERVYPRVFDLIRHLRTRAPVVILSDGDVVFQPRKVVRSGLGAAVGGRVLIFIHKERMLDVIERLHPARHYVVVDDKLRILDAIKQGWGDRCTTVFVRQGHYARDPGIVAHPPADLTVDRIADLLVAEPSTLAGRLPHA